MATWDEIIAACEATLARSSTVPVETGEPAGQPAAVMSAPGAAPSAEQRRRLDDLLRRTEQARADTRARLARTADELEALRERRRAGRAYTGGDAA